MTFKKAGGPMPPKPKVMKKAKGLFDPKMADNMQFPAKNSSVTKTTTTKQR